MDPEIAARIEETGRRVELAADWMERQARVIADRVTVIAERLEQLERDLVEDLLRVRRALGSG